ncbi:hypothetical protein GCM10020331_050490 [Ectobacillus funiculus]
MYYPEAKKVRCMLSKMMLSGANVLLFDDPTNHLDLESITALNNGLISFKGTMLFTSHDHQFVQTIANRVIEITPNGIMDKQTTFDEYLENSELQKNSRTNVCVNSTRLQIRRVILSELCNCRKAPYL